MQEEFLNMKKIIGKTGRLNFTDYEIEFILGTDASNIGQGAAFMQMN